MALHCSSVRASCSTTIKPTCPSTLVTVPCIASCRPGAVLTTGAAPVLLPVTPRGNAILNSDMPGSEMRGKGRGSEVKAEEPRDSRGCGATSSLLPGLPILSSLNSCKQTEIKVRKTRDKWDVEVSLIIKFCIKRESRKRLKCRPSSYINNVQTTQLNN